MTIDTVDNYDFISNNSVLLMVYFQQNSIPPKNNVAINKPMYRAKLDRASIYNQQCFYLFHLTKWLVIKEP